MFKRSLFVAVALVAPIFVSQAHAQENPLPGAAADQNAATGSGPEVFKKGALGLSFGVPGGGAGTGNPTYTIGLAYFTDDKTAFDLLLGFDLHHTPGAPAVPPAMASGDATIFALTAGLGYRMYKHHTGRIHTYLEPFGLISSADLGNISDNIVLGAGVDIGVECMFTDWFSVRGQVGVGVTFAQKFKDIELGTATSGLFATMYWN